MSTLNLPVYLKYTSVSTPSQNFTITLNASTGGISYPLRLPNNNATGFLMNNGTGILSWNPVTSGSFTTPVSVTVNNSSTNGLLTLNQTGLGMVALRFQKSVSSVNDWIIGSDTSDSGVFKFCNSSNLGSVTRMTIDSTSVRMPDRLYLSNYTFPATDGAAGKFLRTNGAGQLYWSDIDIVPTFPALDITTTSTSTAGNIVMNQYGTGSIGIYYALNNPVLIRYMTGIDPVDGKFKISNSGNLAVSTLIATNLAGTSVNNPLTVMGNRFPTTYGAAGQYLRTDGAGSLYWATGSGSGGGPPFSIPVLTEVNDTTTTGLFIASQLGSGDSSMQFSCTSSLTQYTIGIDQSDSSKFKISKGSSLGSDDKFIVTSTAVSIVNALLTIGSGVGSYSMPLADGTANQFLKTDGTGNLSWVNVASPSSVVFLGGQAGPISFGTTDSTQVDVLVNNTSQLSLQSSGDIVLGNSGTSNSIFINGGLRYGFRQISSFVGTNLDLSKNDYFVVINTSVIKTITLPSADASNGGRSYILLRKFAGGLTTDLRVLPAMGDNIDGFSYVDIEYQGASLELVCDGNGSWLIM